MTIKRQEKAILYRMVPQMAGIGKHESIKVLKH